MAPVRRLVVDVLKPHDPSLVAFTEHVTEADSVTSATGSLIELDTEVQNVKLTVAGEDLATDAVEAAIEDLGGTIHSIDQVACGAHVVEDAQTPQDP